MLRAVVYNFREGGATQVLARAASRAGRIVYRSYIVDLYRTEVHDVPDGVAAPLDVGRLTFDDLVEARYFKVVAYPEVIRARFAAGHHCIGARIDGELAHVAWLAVGTLPIDRGIPDIVATGVGGVYDVFTLDAFRGRGCMTHSIRRMLRDARGLGLTRLVAAIHPGNLPSISVFRKHGFERIGRLTYRRLLGRTQFDYPAV